MQEALKQLLDKDATLLIPIAIFLMVGVIAVVAIVFGTMARMVNSKESERSRREIAAYIAEGSMTPEDGERLLTAGKNTGKKKQSRCCL